jgi:hypothetical protein
MLAGAGLWSQVRALSRRMAAVVVAIALPGALLAEVDEDQLGAWYMYFLNAPFKGSPWGLQGDVQYRSWDMGGDLEQVIVRGAVSYRLDSADVEFALGYGNFVSGEFGDDDTTITEHRTHQDALLSQQFGSRLYLRHRLRYEQRWIDGQDFRTRYRYALAADVPLNRTDLGAGAVYLALVNEIFLNGQRGIGDGREVDVFDRNWAYAAIGYSISNKLRLQVGYMHQVGNFVDKSQLQLSLHQRF